MQIETLEEKIMVKAQNLTADDIQEFIDSVKLALEKLLMNKNDVMGGYYKFSDKSRIIFDILKSDDVYRGWPTFIREVRAEKIKNDILSRMDELQKLMMTKEIETNVEFEESKLEIKQ